MVTQTLTRLALIEPDIPQNTGAILRLGACFGVPVDLIGPMGFVMSDRSLRRAGLDYIDPAGFTIHDSWNAFLTARAPGSRLILLTTKASEAYHQFTFQPGDILMAGRESAGAPEYAHAESDARIIIPMRADARSLNVAQACAIVAAEALRQTGGFATLRN